MYLDPRTHNGTITIRNRSTGEHRTFRIQTQPDNATFCPGSRLVSILCGPNNSSDYRNFGFATPVAGVWLWKKFCNDRAYEVYQDMLLHPRHWENRGYEYMCEGRCRRCNRKLTTPESIESGIGPVCAGRE